jgi:hypothetical protein
VSALLCLDGRQMGWELPASGAFVRPAPVRGAPPSRSLIAPAGGMSFTCGPCHAEGPVRKVISSELALHSEPPAGFEPTTPALQGRSPPVLPGARTLNLRCTRLLIVIAACCR